MSNFAFLQREWAAVFEAAAKDEAGCCKSQPLPAQPGETVEAPAFSWISG